MKKNGFLAIIAMAALSFAACNKEGLPQEGNNTDLPSDESTPVVLEPGVYPATVVAEPIMPDLAGTKAVFDNVAFAWEAGDAIACFQRFDKEYVAAESNVLTKMWATDVDGNFSGNLPYTALTEKTIAYAMNFIYPASVVKKIIDASGSTALVECVQVELPAVQDGRMEYLGDYFITGAYNVSCTAQTVGGAVESITTDSDVVLNKYQVVCLKLNVPEDLNIQRVAVKAFAGDRERGIAGKANLNIRNNQIKGNNNWSSKVVSIEHDDESVISGNTYACVSPFILNTTDSDVDVMKFILTNTSGQSYTFSKAVSNLQRGTIYNMGSFPTSCITPKFSFDEKGAVVMTTSPAEAKIYYTTDGSDPSAEATLYEGPVEITADTQFKAIAICEGLGNSDVAEYTVSLNVSAPEIVVTSTGEISVNPVSGLTYKYSMTTDGSIPDKPETELDVETGINILNTGTGTYKIRISATNAFGNTAETKAQYRIYYEKEKTTATVSIVPGVANTEAFAPFVVNNYHESATLNLTKSNSNYWKFGKTNNVASQQNVYIGVYTEYQSNMSFHTYLSANKKTYTRYGGAKGVGPNGMTNYAALNGETPVHAAKTWNSWWTAGPVETEKLVEFSLANDALVIGWGVLEQGFEAFNPTAASLSSEAPAAGQNVAY